MNGALRRVAIRAGHAASGNPAGSWHTAHFAADTVLIETNLA